ncbi:MAG: response regulator [Bacteroidetes bacterium]|nr:response regulator [Bacteroidota bacterium]
MPEKPAILIVEDEEFLRVLLKEMIAEYGYKVYEAGDGYEAIETFEQHKDEILIVLSDLGLPRLGGWEAFEKMKEINPRVEGILASGYFDPQLRAKILATGAKHFVQKPYNPPEIIDMIESILNGKSQ